jgi:hypothetical protein
MQEESLARLVTMFERKTLVTAEVFRYGKAESTVGVIQEMPKDYSGVWGYGGDRVAVRINNEWWPGAKVEPAPPFHA